MAHKAVISSTWMVLGFCTIWGKNMSNRTDTLTVSFLGNFTIQCRLENESRLLTEQDCTSRQIWLFLQYLLAFHKKYIAQDELIDILWDNADIADPVNTLKTLLHHSRALLERLGFPSGKDILLYRRGVYSWNPQLRIITEIDQFDALCSDFSEGNPQTALNAALQAIRLYQGDFLPNASGSPWTVSIRTYYHNKYLRLCCDAGTVLKNQKQFQEAIDICRAATTCDPYSEACHLLLLRLLSESGAQQTALQHYNYVTNLFMDHLGVRPSEEMTALYYELAKSGKKVETNLLIVRDDLEKTSCGVGAFFCEYAVFQNIYQLESRSALRSGQDVQLAVITLAPRAGHSQETGWCAAAMEDMKAAIASSLRGSDSFTRFSPTQYLILLPSANCENGIAAIQRVLYAFDRMRSSSTASPSFSLLPMLPFSQLSDYKA